jgi:hypothetical protein
MQNKMETPWAYAFATPTDFKNLNIGGMAKYLTTMSPFILTSFLILSSCFNQDAKGFVWMGLVGAGLGLVYIVQNIYASMHDPIPASRCEALWGLGFRAPSATSFFLAFTLAYFLAPMYSNNDYNFSAIAVLLLLYMMDAVFNYMNRCADADDKNGANMISIGLGSVMGLLMGGTSYFVIKEHVSPKLVYFSGAASNGEYCTKAKKQTFKCNVYKNGEIISTI